MEIFSFLVMAFFPKRSFYIFFNMNLDWEHCFFIVLKVLRTKCFDLLNFFPLNHN